LLPYYVVDILLNDDDIIFFYSSDNLMKNKTSFIYGENPNEVPIYAEVDMCSGDGDFNYKNG
jgi:hypothetical protein